MPQSREADRSALTFMAGASRMGSSDVRWDQVDVLRKEMVR
jgi:hypothetical protein